MKKQKKIIIFLAVLLGICISATAFAANDADIVVSLKINDPIMEINGIETEIDYGRDTKPIVVDGRTLVPIRAIIEAFDGDVSWDDASKMVKLTMDDDVITLIIDSKRAYLNNAACTLDVAPAIINGRTMLPIRFIAEGFNLGVAWEGNTQTVTIIQNYFDNQEYNYLMNIVPAYSGSPYVQVNNGTPLFKEYEIIGGSFEYYSKLDEFGRCDVAMASISEDIMPGDERDNIGSVTPTGWKNKKYDVVSGGYVYNRCHLIGYQLTGENANERNLITGTRYLNIEGMLPFENMVDDYIENTGNHVMYRVTPVFKGSNLVADGVLMEAYSVEDKGRGVSFCVYCYNVQPYIYIDYITGDNYLSGNTSVVENTPVIDNSVQSGNNTLQKVYKTPTGKRYHLDPDCGGKNSFETTYNEAISSGLTPCSKCAK